MLEVETRGQSTSQAWKNARASRITASNMGKICTLRKSTNPSKTVRALLHGNFRGNEATLFGKLNESKAILEFSNLYDLNVEPCGIFIHPIHYYLGASPDGIIGSGAIIEVKCLAKCQNETPMAAVLGNKVPCAKITNGRLELKRGHNYYYQVQGQLNICNKEKCYFMLWSPKGLLVEEIMRDEQFFTQSMIPKLKSFYFDIILKELVDSPISRDLPLRTESSI